MKNDPFDIPKFLKIDKKAEERRRKARESMPTATATVHRIDSYRPSWRTDEEHAAMLKAQEDRAMQQTAPKPVKEAKPERAPKVKGEITVADIAKKLGMLPRIARGILRDKKIAKPAHGWSGDKAWGEMIEKELKDVPVKSPGKAKKVKPPKINPDDTVWSGRAKTKNGNDTPAAKALAKQPKNIIEKKTKEAGKRTIVASNVKDGRWKIAVDGVTIKEDGGKVLFFKSAAECTKYAKAHYGCGVSEFKK